MDSGPLAGKRIVVTRAPEQAQELRQALESLGAEVLLLPTVAFVPPEDFRALDEALSKLSGFDAILFLSKNAVRYVFERCRYLGVMCWLDSPKRLVAAVGAGTAEAAAAQGLHVDYVARNQGGEALVKELGDRIAGRNVLLPRSDRGDARLTSALRAAGARVTEVIAYRTAVPETMDAGMLARVRRGEVDAIIFASPSAFTNFSDLMNGADLAELSARVQFAAIGPTTAHTMRGASVRVEIEAAEPSAAGLAGAIAEYYQRHTAQARRA
ncbi:MAG: uroporphyrinogen-III synthase [Candidatus Acidiferrales bacterium]